MKILVTGANGFIGQHVVRAVRQAGHTAIALDISLPHFHANVFADITQPLYTVEPLDKLDAVIHLAALSHPRQCDENPGKAFDINVNGTSNVLRMALASGAKKFVFASSAHVYDIPPKWLPTDETHLLRLNNTYTTTKILGEQLCELYWTNHGLSYMVLRLFNAYGPGQVPGYFVPDQLAKAQAGKIDLQGSDITKDWVFVTDVAAAFVKAVSSDFVGPVNVGTGVETTLGAIAQIIASAYQVELDAQPAAAPTRMCADIRRAERVLGWKPTISLEDGIRNILDIPVRTVSEMTESKVAI